MLYMIRWPIPGQNRVKIGSRLGQNRVKIGSKLGQNWVKIGSKSGQKWVKIGSRLGQDWVKIGSKSGQNWIKIGSRWYHGAIRQHHRINETISFARVFFSRLWVELIFRTTNLCHFFKKSYVIFIVWPIFSSSNVFTLLSFYSFLISFSTYVIFHIFIWHFSLSNI